MSVKAPWLQPRRREQQEKRQDKTIKRTNTTSHCSPFQRSMGVSKRLETSLPASFNCCKFRAVVVEAAAVVAGVPSMAWRNIAKDAKPRNCDVRWSMSIPLMARGEGASVSMSDGGNRSTLVLSKFHQKQIARLIVVTFRTTVVFDIHESWSVPSF